MTDLRGRLLRRFRQRDYRHSYVESFLNSLVSTQIRLLREREGWSQEKLAKKIGTTQSGVSRVENPNYSAWRIETLRKIAEAFDMALSVRFVSFGDMVDDIERFGVDRLIRPRFEDDPAFDGDGTPDAPIINFSSTPAYRRRMDSRQDNSTENVEAARA